MSENSTDRDFEDYFAANAPVDALSKMEKAVQLLETIETEELRRTEQAMVSSALKSLRHSLQRWHRFRDEDTAGDSVQSDYTESGDSVQREQTELEPAAYEWLQLHNGVPAGRVVTRYDPLLEFFGDGDDFAEREPLVRLSDVLQFIRQRIEKVERMNPRQHISEEAKDDPLMQNIADSLKRTRHHELLRIEKKLEEFTQNGGSE